MSESKEHNPRFITLKYIVQQYMLFKGESAIHNYIRYYQMALNGFKELNYDVNGTVTTCIKSLLPNLTIKLPKDYVSYIRIGVIRGGGVNWLGKNANIIIDKCDNVLNEGRSTHDIDETLSFYYNQQSNGGVGGMYGLGGGNNVHGYYNVDIDKGQIAFSNVAGGNILLEYISDGTKEGGEVFVDSFMLTCIHNYIHYQQSMHNKNISLGEKQFAKMEYNESRSVLVERNKSFTKEEFIQTIRKGNKLTPKF